jgi:hypothetical protein
MGPPPALPPSQLFDDARLRLGADAFEPEVVDDAAPVPYLPAIEPEKLQRYANRPEIAEDLQALRGAKEVDLQTMKVTELRTMARDMGLSKMRLGPDQRRIAQARKADLIAAIQEAQAGGPKPTERAQRLADLAAQTIEEGAPNMPEPRKPPTKDEQLAHAADLLRAIKRQLENPTNDDPIAEALIAKTYDDLEVMSTADNILKLDTDGLICDLP